MERGRKGARRGQRHRLVSLASRYLTGGKQRVKVGEVWVRWGWGVNEVWIGVWVRCGRGGEVRLRMSLQKLAEVLALTCMYVRTYVPTCETRLT